MARTNNGPRLKKNGFGTWEVHWSENGRSRRRSTGTQDAEEAQQVLAQFISLKDSYQAPDTTVSTLLDVYWREHGENRAAKRQLRCVLDNLEKRFGFMRPDEITPSLCSRYAKDSGKSAGTMRKELSILSAVINYGVKTRRVRPDQKPWIPRPEKPPARDRWLTRDEAARLLQEAARFRLKDGRKSRLERFIMLALHTASRRDAIERLTWSQIDLGAKRIRLRAAGQVETTKRRATVPINSILHEFLTECAQEATSNLVLDRHNRLDHQFRRCTERAGLEGVTPHTLRHTSATWMAQKGVPLWEIAGVLGDTHTTVERNYAHHHPDYLKSAVEALESGAESGQNALNDAPLGTKTDQQRPAMSDLS